jgi:hypothetical protein
MIIYVKHVGIPGQGALFNDGEPHPLEIPTGGAPPTCASLYAKIAALDGRFAQKRLALVHVGHEIPMYSDGYVSDLKPGDVINVVVRPTVRRVVTRFSLRAVYSATVPPEAVNVDVTSEDTVASVKLKICEKLGERVSSIYLISCGLVLHDQATLADCKITEGGWEVVVGQPIMGGMMHLSSGFEGRT